MLLRKPTDIEWRYTEEGEQVRVSVRTGRIIPKPVYQRKDGIIPQQWKGGVSETLKTNLVSWHKLFSCSYTGFEPELLTSQVRLHTPWATEQTYRLRKPVDMKLDMCDSNVQKHTFSNLPAY